MQSPSASLQKPSALVAFLTAFLCALSLRAHAATTYTDAAERRTDAATDLSPGQWQCMNGAGITISATAVDDGQAPDQRGQRSVAAPAHRTARRFTPWVRSAPAVSRQTTTSDFTSTTHDPLPTSSTTSSTSEFRIRGDVLVSMRSADGAPFIPDFVANQTPVVWWNSNAVSVTCAGEGNFVVTWLQSGTGCVMSRSFDRRGRPNSDEAELRCPDYPGYVIVGGAAGTATEVWLYLRADQSMALRVDAATNELVDGSIVPIDSAPDGYPTIAARGDVAAIAWESRDGIHATILTPEVVTDLVRLDTYPDGNKYRVRISPHQRSFLVSWHSDNQGGRVGREISRAPISQPNIAPTTTLPADGQIEFGEPQVIDREEAQTWLEEGGRHDLATDAESVWLTTWRRSDFAEPTRGPLDGVAHSSNNGRTWSEEPIRDTENLWGWSDAHAAADRAGSWLQVWNGWASSPNDDDAVWMSHSGDDARSWQAPRLLDAPPADDVYHPHAIHTVISPAANTWVVPATRYTDSQNGSFEAATLILYRSADDALSWKKAATFELGRGEFGWRGGAAAATRDGRIFVIWLQDGELRTTTSSDAGLTWTAPRRLHAQQGIRYGAPSDVSAAMSASGVGIVAWNATGLFGADSDIVYSRTSDAGLHWTSPAPLADYSERDEDEDREPSVAVDADGHFAAAWVTHFDRGGAWGMDADVVVAESSGGSDWSPARRIRPESTGEFRIDIRPRIAVSAPGVWGVLWAQKTIVIDRKVERDKLLFARWDRDCGNGRVDAGEVCDDGNSIEGDACDSNCAPPSCGNGIVDTGEECDDANVVDSDACLASCLRASCGDGLIRTNHEECDDGNRDTHDACTNKCNVAKCGDGIVQYGTEECDDGNSWWSDSCLPLCRKARCGDGVLRSGKENCDDGNDNAADSCTNECTFGNSCGPSAQRTAAQALGVLAYALEILPNCVIDNCDVDADGRVTTTDALGVLRQAVGLGASTCSPLSGWIAIRLLSPAKLGALQVRVDYEGAFDRIARNEDGEFACHSTIEDALIAVNDVPGAEFTMGLISLKPFAGPLDLIVCRVESGIALNRALDVTIEDSTDTNGEPVQVDVIVVPR